MRAALILSLWMGAAAAFADVAVTRERTVTRLAEGVYAIRHADAPDEFPQGNTTVIIGQRAVLVVDSCYMPSSAREDIAQIRAWTDKPVRYLVNTHWHYDHTMGNGAYAEAFPGLAVIAHTETRRNMAGYNPHWFARYPRYTANDREMLRTGKDEAGQPLTDARRAEIERSLPGRAPVATEFAAVVDRIPDTTFDREMTVDLGGRVVQIRHLGRGNTAGDAIVYLPAEKIAVAGDMLTHPIPYLGGGYPTELPSTLRALAQLDAVAIVPGHGEILRDKAYLHRVIAFVEALNAAMSDQVYRSPRRGDFETVKAAVLGVFDVTPWRKEFAGDDPGNLEYFDDFSWPGLLKASHAELSRR
jgi:glyoxylase-like metal-dependent hydrolase (beta-lactamase superfamily II)